MFIKALKIYEQFFELMQKWLEPFYALIIRLYIFNEFFWSGWLKVKDIYNGQWDRVVYLFEEEYKVPLLSPELAAAFEVSSQGLGICSTLLKAAVEVWAEEVNGIGVGKIVDDHFPQLQAAFRCFGGDALRRFDATYNPLNGASGKVLAKAGFVKAQSALCSDNTFDLTNMDLSLARVEDAEIIATKFLEGREPNKRYICIDQEGVEHTLSYKENFKSFRFHVERQVGGVGI